MACAQELAAVNKAPSGLVGDQSAKLTAQALPEIEGELGGDARVWAALERLARETPESAERALSGAEILINMAASAPAKAALLTALRTEVPKHFAFEEVRARAFSSLAPYLTEAEVFKVFISELEKHPDRKISCAAVVEVFNKAPAISERGQVDSILKLFITERANATYDEILRDLIPTLSVRPSKEVSTQLKELADKKYKAVLNPEPFQLKALAISNDPELHKFLAKLARQDFYSWGDSWNDLKYGALFCAGTLVVTTGIGSLMYLHFGKGLIYGLFLTTYFAVRGVLDKEYDLEWPSKNQMRNETAAAEAISALSHARGSRVANDTLEELAVGRHTPRELKNAALTALTKLK